MPFNEMRKKEIEEEEKYRHAVVKSIKQSNKNPASQKHGAPLILSIFIPGLGQLVKGEVKKGLYIFFGPIIAFIIIFIIGFFGGKGSGALSLLGTLWMVSIILYFWQLLDAYNN